MAWLLVFSLTGSPSLAHPDELEKLKEMKPYDR
jgi:hypothetical protein